MNVIRTQTMCLFAFTSDSMEPLPNWCTMRKKGMPISDHKTSFMSDATIITRIILSTNWHMMVISEVECAWVWVLRPWMHFILIFCRSFNCKDEYTTWKMPMLCFPFRLFQRHLQCYDATFIRSSSFLHFYASEKKCRCFVCLEWCYAIDVIAMVYHISNFMTCIIGLKIGFNSTRWYKSRCVNRKLKNKWEKKSSHCSETKPLNMCHRHAFNNNRIDLKFSYYRFFIKTFNRFISVIGFDIANERHLLNGLEASLNMILDNIPWKAMRTFVAKNKEYGNFPVDFLFYRLFPFTRAID